MADFARKFDPKSPDDVARLMDENPLAWIVSRGAGGPAATVLPVRAVTGEEGRIVALRGHFARANPQLAGLRADPRALILTLGPHGYISPSWMADRAQAPTWNYASAWFDTELTFFEEPAKLEALLRDLVGVMEDGRDDAWSIDAMGARYEMLSRGIVGFEARVVQSTPRFKLGQDERDDVYADITAGLAAEGRDALLAWMERFNRGPKGS